MSPWKSCKDFAYVSNYLPTKTIARKQDFAICSKPQIPRR